MLSIIKIIFQSATLILYSLMVLSAFGGYIDPHTSSIPSILALAFPIFLILTIITAGIWTFLRNRLMTLCGAGVLILCIYPILVYSPINISSDTVSPTDKTFTLMTYNVYYGVDTQKPELPYSRTMSYIINSGVDIVCMQEQYALKTHINKKFTDAQVDSLRNIYPYRLERGSSDVVILSKFPIRQLEVAKTPDLKYFTFDACEADIYGEKISIINLHLSSYDLNSDERNVVTNLNSLSGIKASAKDIKHSIFHKLSEAFVNRAEAAEIVRKFADEINGPLIICGDFNDVPGSWAYRTIKGDDMTDAYCECGFGPMITYNANMMFFNIDHILYRGNMKAINFEKGRIKSSDHYPIFTKFALSNE